MKPYRHLPIAECGEPLVPLADTSVLLTEPAPYLALGAQYDDHTGPWCLRSGVRAALLEAAKSLHNRQPGWRLKLYDAYRPNSVQQFMVNHEFSLLSRGRAPDQLNPVEREHLWIRTYRIWAQPSDDPLTPPPHSTGAALDLTLADASGAEVDMGSPIDENSDRSSPDHFAGLNGAAHGHRQLLLDVMTAAGFRRHPSEWWHFSLGDQLWAWLELQANPAQSVIARYGRADLLAAQSAAYFVITPRPTPV